MRLLTKAENRKIGQAMHDYRMLSDGDRVLVGVSGGVDSLVLAWLLHRWRDKAPIDYQVLALHLDLGFTPSQIEPVETELAKIGLPFRSERTSYGTDANQDQPGAACHRCAAARRRHLFEVCRAQGYNTLALGHHQDDLIETFFLNLLYSGNLSTMLPRQDLFAGRLKIIRPLAYLDKEQARAIAARLALSPVKNPCPMAAVSKRETVRRQIHALAQDDPRLKANIFAALHHVRPDYLPPGRPAG